MEFDPLSRDVPPSRHDVESDSEDSDDEQQQFQPTSSTGEGSNRTKKAFVPPSFTLKSSTGDASISPSSPLTIFIGTSGEAFVRNNSQFVESFVLNNSDNGEQQGALDHSRSATYALIRPETASAQQAAFPYLASYLLDTLRPSSVIIVDEYYPALYLSDTERDYGEAQPIRILNAGQPALQITKANKNIQPFVAPNYITGLGAALLAHAANINTPASLVLVPQERSVNPHLQTLQRVPNASSSLSDRPEALDTLLSQELSSLLSIQAPKQQNSATTTRSLDAFLNERRTRERKKQQNEISAMYM